MTAAIITSTLMTATKKATAQTNSAICRFNGNSERCVVNWRWSGSSEHIAQVTWLSDGKQTWYRAGGDSRNCLITEDNGRNTNCRWDYMNGKIKFTSARGNITIIPSW